MKVVAKTTKQNGASGYSQLHVASLRLIRYYNRSAPRCLASEHFFAGLGSVRIVKNSDKKRENNLLALITKM